MITKISPILHNYPPVQTVVCHGHRIDAHFGNILQALEDPNGDGDRSDSVADNTLVVFSPTMEDRGGSNREQLDANGGLLGSKGSIYEGGIRVPTIMCWPNRITGESKLKAGSNSDLVLDCSDLLPTFCELAGAPVGVREFPWPQLCPVKVNKEFGIF